MAHEMSRSNAGICRIEEEILHSEAAGESSFMRSVEDSSKCIPVLPGHQRRVSHSLYGRNGAFGPGLGTIALLWGWRALVDSGLKLSACDFGSRKAALAGGLCCEAKLMRFVY